MISLWKIVKEASRELRIQVPSIIPPSTSCTNKRVYENRWVFFSLQICPDVTSASLAVISSCLASWADLHVWSLFGWRQPRKTLACTTAVWLIQWMALSLLSQHWVTGGARCYGTWYFQRSRVSTKIQTKIQLRAKHSSCQPGQSAQQLSACKKSESQRVFYFLPDRKTRWFHPIMKNKTFTSSRRRCSVFPGDQAPHRICTQGIRPLVLLFPPTFAWPRRAIYRPSTPPQLLFPPCKTELEALHARP